MLTITDNYYDEAIFCMLKMDEQLDILKIFIDKNLSKFIGHILISNSSPSSLNDKPFFDSEQTYLDLFGENITDIYISNFEYKTKNYFIRLIAFREKR